MREEKNITIPVQTTLMPAYYKEFHCLADECRDSCCIGWAVTLAKRTICD